MTTVHTKNLRNQILEIQEAIRKKYPGMLGEVEVELANRHGDCVYDEQSGIRYRNFGGSCHTIEQMNDETLILLMGSLDILVTRIENRAKISPKANEGLKKARDLLK